MGGLSDLLADGQPINRKNAAEAVFDDIRSAITTGQLAVGTRLPSEAHLATRYGVSRPIIREALRSLQTLGLTQTRTGSGTYVMTPTPPSELNYGAYSARDLIEARPFIEVPAAGWAALRRTDAQLQVLLDLCSRMETEERPHPWVLLDGQFHCAIAEASANRLFAKVVADAREAVAQQSEMVNLMAGRRVASNFEHRRIVEAIRRGSAPEAREAMELHLGQVKQVVTTIIGEDRLRQP